MLFLFLSKRTWPISKIPGSICFSGELVKVELKLLVAERGRGPASVVRTIIKNKMVAVKFIWDENAMAVTEKTNTAIIN